MARMPANMAPGGGSGAAPPNAGNQMSAAQANAIGRHMLLATGVPMCRLVTQGQALALGQAQRINLLRVGVTTGVLLDFTLSLDITAAMTAALTGPWSIIDHVIYTDFDGVDRVNASAFELAFHNSAKHGELAGNAIPGVIGSFGNINTNILTLPTAISNPAQLQFSVYIPMAVDPANDLRGAVPSMVNVGEHYLTIVPAAAVAAAGDVLSAPYSAGTATVNSFTVDVTQFYIQPRSVAPGDLPAVDLTTIY